MNAKILLATELSPIENDNEKHKNMQRIE